MLKDLKADLKYKLEKEGSNLTQFCKDNQFDYAMFNQVLNGTRNDREEYTKAVKKYLRGE
jgi:hypothetical protein